MDVFQLINNTLPGLERRRWFLRDRLSQDLERANDLVGDLKDRQAFRREMVPAQILWAINVVHQGAAFVAKVSYEDPMQARAHLREQLRVVADNGEIAGVIRSWNDWVAHNPAADQKTKKEFLDIKSASIDAAQRRITNLENQMGVKRWGL